MEFSERLRQLREKHGYTQKQLADFQFDYEINTDRIKQENYINEQRISFVLSLQKKSVFYKIMRILYPFKNALWALRPAKPLGVLSRHPCRNPKPLPRGKGLFCWGYRPQTKQGCLQSVTQSHCTMQWHKWLTTCTGATPLRPHFQKIQRFIDSLRAKDFLCPFLQYTSN